jgi:hypothetical protein
MTVPLAIIEGGGILAMLILTSVIDVIVLNLFMQAREPRQHNKLKLVNEALARHQLAYPIWYVTLIVLATRDKLNAGDSALIRLVMQIAIILSVLFWISGVSGVAAQDQAIREDHGECPPTGKCDRDTARLRFKILILNGCLATVSLTISIIFLTRPSVIIALSP